MEDPSLIIWNSNRQILGHAVWHESNAREHRSGSPRDEADAKLLEKLVGKDKTIVELYEVWLRRECFQTAKRYLR